MSALETPSKTVSPIEECFATSGTVTAPESEPTPEMAVAETVGAALIFGSNRAEVHALLKARREELPLTNAQIAERIGTDRKRITNILGRPDFYKLEVLQGLTLQLESLQAGLSDDELLSIANQPCPAPPQNKQEKRRERDEALNHTRGLYQQARKRFSVDQIAERAGISSTRLGNVLAPSTFCAIPAIRQVGDVLEAMLAEPVAENPLTCSVCGQPSTEKTCHSCISAIAVKAKREGAVIPAPRPKPKQFEFANWMDFAVSEIESGKRTFPQGFSLIRHCIGGDVDSNVWECVPSDQPLKHHEIAYLRFTRAADMWVCNPPSIVNLAHRDAAADLLHRVAGKGCD